MGSSCQCSRNRWVGGVEYTECRLLKLFPLSANHCHVIYCASWSVFAGYNTCHTPCDTHGVLLPYDATVGTAQGGPAVVNSNAGALAGWGPAKATNQATGVSDTAAIVAGSAAAKTNSGPANAKSQSGALVTGGGPGGVAASSDKAVAASGNGPAAANSKSTAVNTNGGPALSQSEAVAAGNGPTSARSNANSVATNGPAVAVAKSSSSSGGGGGSNWGGMGGSKASANAKAQSGGYNDDYGN